MKMYKVVALSVSGTAVGNKVYHCGEIVPADVFEDADQMVKDGFIVEDTEAAANEPDTSAGDNNSTEASTGKKTKKA